MSFFSFSLFSSIKSENRRMEQVLTLGWVIPVGWEKFWRKGIGG
jgi:hypothetical protein